jgi:hypothetical protein
MKLANQKELNKADATPVSKRIDGASLTDKERADYGIPDDVSLEEFIPSYVGPCFNCGRIVSDYDWCYGCKQYVCELCNVNMNISGKHTRSEHLTKGEI